jgi:hypothetical protein
MSIRQFIQKDNITMLWEVIIDEEIFKFLSRDIQAKIYQLFLNNIQGFYENEKISSTSLVNMNKKYILLILNHIKKNYQHQPSKITIHDVPMKESITFEEIQNDRRSQFERDFNRKQEEFEDFMSIKAPPVPEFADKSKDKPIKEMDKILKEMQAQRNYEIEQINRSYNSSINQTDNWLKSQETSLKNEKYTKENTIDKPSQNYSRFKFLNEIGEETSLLVKDKKNVSFSEIEEINTFNVEDEEDDNIFLKLKKVSDNKNENITFTISQKTQEVPIPENKITDDKRILMLEKEIKNINNKIEKILEFLNKN